MSEQWVYLPLDHTDDCHVVREALGGRDVAHVPFASTGDCDRDDELFREAERRARLIAAAPDLLDACRRHLATVGSADGDGSDVMASFAAMRDAITKATGQENDQ